MQRVSGQLVDWSLGRLLEDERLVAAGVQHARWPVTQASAAVTLILFPYSAEAQRWSRGVEGIAAWREMRVSACSMQSRGRPRWVTLSWASVNVDGLSIAYRQAGQGSALVLLHGFLCDSRCWRRQLSGLSDRFRVVAWDAPGAGSSADPADTFTTTDYARCLAGFLDGIGIGRAHIVGLSWGGILAQEFYRLCPERVRCLVLADTYAGWRGSLPEAVWKERLATCLSDSMGPPDALVAKFVPGAVHRGCPARPARRDVGNHVRVPPDRLPT